MYQFEHDPVVPKHGNTVCSSVDNTALGYLSVAGNQGSPAVVTVCYSQSSVAWNGVCGEGLADTHAHNPFIEMHGVRSQNTDGDHLARAEVEVPPECHPKYAND